ncbi:MAG: hypothetical protein J6L99_02520 [Ruminococcus sp.]|nr:hypothetical protein [Ruminococcus sp.]
MDFTVYRQASKVRPDGTVVYKGEDALPYTDAQLYMVADGLGGAAAIRHTKFLPELFDKEKTPAVLFGDVYEDASEGDFADYVRRSFAELYAVKDCYTDNVNNIKKSGYFASRIVTAAMLHEVSEKGADYFFAQLDDASDRQAALDEMGSFFAGRIREVLCKAAESANIIYESSYAGMALLGTTLTAGIVREKDGCAEVILVTAGDSRPYVWTPAEGLRQLVADEERSDGGMTNYIKANEGESFTIDCHYFSFRTPCVLLSASDGCFDSSAFLSPMAFEKLILESIVSANDIAGAAKAMEEFFLDHGRHDDSSTMAAKTFGFSDMAALKKAAEERLGVIKNSFLSKLDGLLTNDFIGMLSSGDDAQTKLIKTVAAEVGDAPEIKDYCRDQVRDGVMAKADTIENDEIKSVKASADVQKKLLRSFIADNIIAFRTDIGNLDDSQCELYELLSSVKMNDSVNPYNIKKNVKDQEELKKEVDENVRKIKSFLEDVITDINILPTIDAIDDEDEFASKMFEGVEEAKKSVQLLYSHIYMIRNNNKKICAEINNYKNLGNEADEEKPEVADIICGLFVSGNISNYFSEDMPLIGCTFSDMENIADIVRSAGERISELHTEAVESEIASQAEKFWNSHAAEMIANIQKGAGNYPDSVKNIIAESIDRNDDSDDSLDDDAKLQKELFDEYYKGYSSIMRGESK